MASVGVMLSSARSVAAFTVRQNGLASSRSVISSSAALASTRSRSAPILSPLATSRIGGGWMSLSSTATPTEEDTSTTNAAAPHDPNYDETNKSLGIIGKYDPSAFESSIYKWWEKEGCFQPDAKRSRIKAEAEDKKPYVLPMPPPNVTGRLHMGHAIFVALQDVLARFHRMRGRPVLWLPGKCAVEVE